MKILNYLKEDNIIIGNIEKKGKEEILTELLKTLNLKTDKIKKKIISGLLERESVGSTAIGMGIAIPHARIEGVDDIFLGIYVLEKGIEYDALDGRPVNAFFIFLSPQEDVKFHLRFLARLSRILRNEELRQRIINGKSPSEIIRVIEEFEKEHMG